MTISAAGARLLLSQCFAPQQGGIETLMLGLARALCAAGHNTFVYADGAQMEEQYDIAAAEKFIIKRVGGWKPWRRRNKARLAAKLLTSSDFVGGDCNTVFCDSWKSMEFMPPANAAVFAHGSEFPLHPSPSKRKRIGAAMDKARIIYAVSQAAAARAAMCGAAESKLRITSPPLSPPLSPPETSLATAEKLWGDGAPRLLTVARLSPRKGIDRTILATAALAAAHPNIKYIVAGGGAQEKELRALARQSGANVFFAGATDEQLKSALYATADIFVLPARAEKNDMEGFGIVYLEASWFGLPILGGNSGGAREAVQDGKTGLLCDGDSDKSVREVLANLLSDKELRRRLGEAAKARAQTQTWDKRIGDFL